MTTISERPRVVHRLQEFLKWVDRSGPITVANQSCWIWTGALHQGYGMFGRGVEKVYGCRKVHSEMWAMVHGCKPSKGDHIHHICHNRACCNPNHLKAVSAKEHTKTYHNKFQEELRQKRLTELRKAIQSEERACA